MTWVGATAGNIAFGAIIFVIGQYVLGLSYDLSILAALVVCAIRQEKGGDYLRKYRAMREGVDQYTTDAKSFQRGLGE